VIAFIGFFLLTAAAASIGALFQPGAWYAGLVKPALTPPDWVFPAAWTILYLMIAVAGWMLWRDRDQHPLGRRAVILWGSQLVLNAAWSWLFFGLHLTGLALVEIVLLWLVILLLVINGYRVRPLASWLLVPYLVWVGFAAWLNLGIWRLNT
jgi:tryptophan-rich sensory protein